MSDLQKSMSDTLSDKPNTSEIEKAEGTIPIDTVHNDEAMKVLANYSGDESWTEEEETKVKHKIDRKLLPLLCLTYGLQYYDKAMLSQAVCPVVLLTGRVRCLISL